MYIYINIYELACLIYCNASGTWLVRRYSIPMPSQGVCEPGKRRVAVRYAAIA